MKSFYKIYIRPRSLRLNMNIMVKLVATLFDLAIPALLAHIIDNIIPARDSRQVFIFGGLMLLSALGGLVLNITANRMNASFTRDVIRDLRYDLFTKISYLTRRRADELTNPSLISRITSDTFNIHRMMTMALRMGVRAPILLLGALFITFTLDSGLALVLLLTQPLVVISVLTMQRVGFPLYKKVQEMTDEIVLILRENITGIRVIRSLSKTAYETQRFEEANENLSAADVHTGMIGAVFQPVIMIILNVGLAMVVLVGAYRVNAGTTHVGVIVAFLSYFLMIMNSLYMISRVQMGFTEGGASYSRITEVLDSESELLIEDIDIKDSEYHIEFNDVSFSYLQNKNNLTNISFKLKQGETLGIIGPTGSGKSSIIRLLLRFYDVSTGEILIGGQNIKSIPFAELYKKFGIVFQDDVIFADTIWENIDFGRQLGEDELERSLRMAQAAEFVYELDAKMDHKLAIKGANLSGGQRQRILISRALASNPEILILDDSSSALDYATDLKLRQSIESEMHGSTTVIVAQRISSIKDSDVIIVMNDGEIDGIGTHEELMRSNEAYKKTSQIQMGA